MATVKIPPRPESSIGRAFVKAMKKAHPGWMVVKLKGDGRRDLPDYMVLGDKDLYGPTMCFLEMKVPGKKPTERQTAMLADLQDRGFDAAWFDDAEEAVLFCEESLL